MLKSVPIFFVLLCKRNIIVKITVLGNSSASPRVDRHPSAQVVAHNQSLYLVDCGEGTQYQIIKHKVKYGGIDHIFISHLHGDHFFGILGLLSVYYLNGRTRPLHIYANQQIEKFIQVLLETTNTVLDFLLIFHYLKPETAAIILETKDLTVVAFPLTHRVPTHGFLFSDKQNISNSFAYCSDTLFDPEIVNYLKEVRLLYHEATFGDDKIESAANKSHSTARQAAQIAKMANVSQLIIGHFSAKYHDTNELLLQAREVFVNTNIALEGCVYEVG